MSFFDVTPLGRILNRFSNDMDRVDTDLPPAAEDWLHYSFNTGLILVIIAMAMPWFVVCFIPVGAVFYSVLVCGEEVERRRVGGRRGNGGTRDVAGIGEGRDGCGWVRGGWWRGGEMEG
jgi:ABC-type multidrug transport system fused ATPase/permease subunit